MTKSELIAELSESNPHLRSADVELIVAKQRAGSTGSIGLTNQQHYGRFVDWAGGA